MNFFKYIAFLIASFYIAFEAVYTYTSIDRLYEFIFFLFIYSSYRADLKTNKVIELTSKLLMIFLLLIVLRMFTIFIVSSELEFTLIRDFVRVFFMLFYFYIVYYLISKNFKILYLIVGLNFLIMLAAFFEADITPLTDETWEFKYTYFKANSMGFEDTVTFRKRVIGLYATAIPLAYILASNMVITLYLYIKNENLIFVLYFFMLGMIAIFTQTRSVLLSWIVLFIYLIYIHLFKGSFFRRIMTIGLMVIAIFSGGNFYLNNTEFTEQLNRVSNVDDDSAQGRGPLMLTGLYTVLKHPFGHTKDDYTANKEEIYVVSNNLDVLKFPAHNGLLSIGFKYTIFGIIIFFIYLLLMRNIVHKYLPSKYKAFFTVSFIAYLLNGFFHNNFLFVEDFYALIIIAIIAYEYQLSRKGNLDEV